MSGGQCDDVVLNASTNSGRSDQLKESIDQTWNVHEHSKERAADAGCSVERQNINRQRHRNEDATYRIEGAMLHTLK